MPENMAHSASGRMGHLTHLLIIRGSNAALISVGDGSSCWRVGSMDVAHDPSYSPPDQ